MTDLTDLHLPLQTLHGVMRVFPIRPPDAAEMEPLRERASSGQFVCAESTCAFCAREGQCRAAVDRWDGSFIGCETVIERELVGAPQ